MTAYPTLPLPALPLPGDFGLTPTYGSFAMRLVRWGTDSPVNHAFIYLGEHDGTGLVVEAAPGGARRTLLSDYDPAGIRWSTGHIELTDGERRHICAAASVLADVGIEYGWADIVAITLAQHRLHRLVNTERPPWWVRKVANGGSLICSQLVDVCYQNAGIRLFTDGRLPGLVSPGDLLGVLHGARRHATGRAAGKAACCGHGAKGCGCRS